MTFHGYSKFFKTLETNQVEFADFWDYFYMYTHTSSMWIFLTLICFSWQARECPSFVWLGPSKGWHHTNCLLLCPEKHSGGRWSETSHKHCIQGKILFVQVDLWVRWKDCKECSQECNIKEQMYKNTHAVYSEMTTIGAGRVSHQTTEQASCWFWNRELNPLKLF